MHLNVLILVVIFGATTGFPVLQNTGSSRAEPLWDYSSQKYNQAADKTELIKEVDSIRKSSLENIHLYSDLYAQDIPQSQGPLAGDLRRKLNLESQRLHARLTQELRELRERLASAFASHPAPTSHDHLARQLRDTLDGNTRELCSRLGRYLQRSETAGGPAPEQGTHYQEAVRGMGRALGDSDRELTARLAEFQTEASSVAGGRGETAAALRSEVEAFSTRVRSRAESLRAGLAGTQSPGEGLSKQVEQFCRSSEEENRLFVGRIERQLEALGQGQSEGPGEVPSFSPSSMGSLVEDFSPKLNALLQDILQTLN